MQWSSCCQAENQDGVIRTMITAIDKFCFFIKDGRSSQYCLTLSFVFNLLSLALKTRKTSMLAWLCISVKRKCGYTLFFRDLFGKIKPFSCWNLLVEASSDCRWDLNVTSWQKCHGSILLDFLWLVLKGITVWEKSKTFVIIIRLLCFP